MEFKKTVSELSEEKKQEVFEMADKMNFIVSRASEKNILDKVVAMMASNMRQSLLRALKIVEGGEDGS